MSFKNIVSEVIDIEECIKKDIVKVIPLKRKSKQPKDNNYYNKEYTLEKLKKYNGNFGVVIGYNHEKNNQSLSIVDIDGLGGEYKKETADYIYNCLKDIPGAMLVETQSGGKHIYLWNRTISEKIHETSKHLHFPDDFPIAELRGKSLNHSIEIYTKPNTRQCLLPGCVVLNNDTGNLNDYHILSHINKLQDIGVVDNINETIKDKLLSHGFGWSESTSSSSSLRDAVEFEKNNMFNTVLKELDTKEVVEVANLISQLLPKMDGAKHEASMCLGGYFSTRISKKSAKKNM